MILVMVATKNVLGLRGAEVGQGRGAVPFRGVQTIAINNVQSNSGIVLIGHVCCKTCQSFFKSLDRQSYGTIMRHPGVTGDPRVVLKKPSFFLLRSAPRNHQLPTTTNRQLPTAADRH